MVYYTWCEKEIAKHGEIIKAEFRYLLHFEKHKGQRVDYKGTTNANPVNDIQTKYQAWVGRKTISFWTNRKIDRTYDERVDDRLEAESREPKAISERHDESRWWREKPVRKAKGDSHILYRLEKQGDITKESEEMQIEALKEEEEGSTHILDYHWFI